MKRFPLAALLGLIAVLVLDACAKASDAASDGDVEAAQEMVVACAVANTPIAAALRGLPDKAMVSESTGRDVDSGEPTLKNDLGYADGTRITVEQHSCEIANLRIAMQAPAALDAAQVRRLAGVLATTPLWQRHYAGSRAADVIAKALAIAPVNETVPLDLPPAAGEISDALLTVNATTGGAPSAVTLEFSVSE